MKTDKSRVVVALKNVNFAYNETDEVLHDLSLDIFEGETIAIVGHNGSGKSTIAKLIGGILEVKDGDIEINGVSLKETKKNNEQKLHIGIVFQNPDNQFIGTTVEDDIAFGLENQRVPRLEMDAIIDDVLAKVKMEGFRKREPEQLSGGQKQRIAIAGALALKPDILIMDEATAMLDPQGKREISDVLHDLKKEKEETTLILITHDLEETLDADRVIVLNKGQVVLSGSPLEVYQNEEELKRINLDVPFFFRLRNRLLKDGYKIEHIHRLEELVRYIHENRIS